MQRKNYGRFGSVALLICSLFVGPLTLQVFITCTCSASWASKFTSSMLLPTLVVSGGSTA